MDHQKLQQIYQTASSIEELEAALSFHGVPLHTLLNIASEKGWNAGPAAMALSLEAASDSEPANPDFISSANKAAVRNLQVLHNLSVIKYRTEQQVEPSNAYSQAKTVALLAKTQKLLSDLEMGLFGLSTAPPVSIDNPINIFMSQETEE